MRKKKFEIVGLARREKPIAYSEISESTGRFSEKKPIKEKKYEPSHSAARRILSERLTIQAESC